MTPEQREQHRKVEIRCGHANGALRCDREPNHEGNHCGYNAQIDEPMFWPNSQTAPWMVAMDFPTAWAFIREQHPDPNEHDPRCSWVQASGGILCDCHVINDEYARRKAHLDARLSALKE